MRFLSLVENNQHVADGSRHAKTPFSSKMVWNNLERFRANYLINVEGNEVTFSQESTKIAQNIAVIKLGECVYHHQLPFHWQ